MKINKMERKEIEALIDKLKTPIDNEQGKRTIKTPFFVGQKRPWVCPPWAFRFTYRLGRGRSACARSKSIR